MTTSARVTHAVTTCEKEAYTIAMEGFHYLYPLVLMEATRRQTINFQPNKRPGMGPPNQFSHMRAYPDADFRAVVRPNFDTLYSSAWLDLSEEAQVISVPDADGRYYLLPMLDMWTDVFAAPGWRTSGTNAQLYLVTPPGWKGTVPGGMQRISAPTNWAWIIGRVKTDGPDDYAAVHKFQDGLSITPLSQWGKAYTAPEYKIDESADTKTPPMEQVDTMGGDKFFELAAGLLQHHRPHLTDWSLLSRLERIAFVPGQDFDMSKFNDACKKAVMQAAVDALQMMREKSMLLGRLANGWIMATDTMGVYGNAYLKRAMIALVGLGANQAEDAVYPLNVADADGKPLNGDNNYVLHFEANAMPPVDAFWSVTMYDAGGFQAANVLNRFAISSWMPLKKNADGSLDLYIQNSTPGADKESNWLPAPKGQLGVTMRLYGPQMEVLNGSWNPPAIRRV